MSFVPAPQQASTANAKSSNAVTSSNQASAQQEADASNDNDFMFKMRTFDVFWVEKHALMYKDGISKVRIAVRRVTRNVTLFQS